MGRVALRASGHLFWWSHAFCVIFFTVLIAFSTFPFDCGYRGLESVGRISSCQKKRGTRHFQTAGHSVLKTRYTQRVGADRIVWVRVCQGFEESRWDADMVVLSVGAYGRHLLRLSHTDFRPLLCQRHPVMVGYDRSPDEEALKKSVRWCMR